MPAAPDEALRAAVAHSLAGARRVAAAESTAALLGAEAPALVLDPLDDLAGAQLDAVVLGPEVLERHDGPEGPEGEADAAVAAAADALRPGGRVVVWAPSRLGANDPAGITASEARRLIGHRGVVEELLVAPGVGARLTGRPPVYDLATDREPGLLDAGPWVVVAGTWTGDPARRTAAFMATLPRKVLSAAVICRDPDGRLLVVHDTYRNHWTIPGGVVDPAEPLDAAAARETWEESGVAVDVGALLGVFTASPPDRMMAAFAATPRSGGAPEPAPRHTHEVDDAAWWTLDRAMADLAPHTAWEVRCCLDSPGRAWHR